MSIHIMTAVWQCGPQDMPARMLLLAIADNANERGEAFPSIAVLQQKACMSKSTAIRTLQRLAAEGWLVVRRRAAAPEDYGRARGNLYCIALAKLRLQSYGPRGVNVTPRQPADECASRGVIVRPRQADEVSDEVSETARRGVKQGVALIVEPSEPIRTTPLPPNGGSSEELSAFREKRVHREQAAFLEQQLALARARGVEPVTRPAPIACVDTGPDPPQRRRQRRWTPAMIGARM